MMLASSLSHEFIFPSTATVNFVKWRSECDIFLLCTCYSPSLISYRITTISCSYLHLQSILYHFFYLLLSLHRMNQAYASTLGSRIMNFPSLYAFVHAVLLVKNALVKNSHLPGLSKHHSSMKVFLPTLSSCRITWFFVCWRHLIAVLAIASVLHFISLHAHFFPLDWENFQGKGYDWLIHISSSLSITILDT